MRHWRACGFSLCRVLEGAHCRSCGLGELAGSRVMFLREQVKNLRVHEFFRQLVVDVVALSDLAGTILVEILHNGEGGDVEQMARTTKQFSHFCDCLSLCLTCVYIYLACFHC